MLCSLERVHPEGDVHARAVGEEGGQSGLLKQPKDQDFVPETHRQENGYLDLNKKKKLAHKHETTQ